MSVGIITGSGTHALPGFEDGESVSVTTPFGETTRDPRNVCRRPDPARLSPRTGSRASLQPRQPPREHLGAQGARRERGHRLHGVRSGRPDARARVARHLRRSPFHRQPAAGWVAMHVLRRAGRSRRAPTGSSTAGRSRPISARRSSRRRRAPVTPLATVVPTVTSTARASTRRPRSRSSPPAASSAVSQTAGPETVLCGELELPFALMGFVTDYANEVVPGEPTPVATLIELMGRSPAIFADVLRGP